MKPIPVLCESLQRVLDEGDFDSALSLCRERLDADLRWKAYAEHLPGLSTAFAGLETEPETTE